MHNGVLFCHKPKYVIDKKMGGAGGHHVKEKKPVSE